MSKFFVPNNQIKNGIVTIYEDDVNHIVNVLRLEKKDIIYICDKDENITYETEIFEITKEKVTSKIIKRIQESTETNIKVTIFQGLPKVDKMEYIIQKTTELGVTKIVPVSLKRCIVKIDKKDEDKKITRWQKIAEVAAKQSGRDMIPKINNIVKIDEIKNTISDFDLFLVAYEEEKEKTLKEVLTGFHTKKIKANKELNLEKEIKEQKIGVVIGPEGGIEKEEINILKENGAKIVSLGNRILRTETAPISILSNIIYEFEE